MSSRLFRHTLWWPTAAFAQLAPLSARILPSRRDGAPAGFKLFGIRPGLLFERLGLNNGDRVDTINQKPVADLEALNRAVKGISDAKRIVVGIVRRGRQLSMRYDIR